MSKSHRGRAAIRHALATASALAGLSCLQAQAAPPLVTRSPDLTAASSAVLIPNPGSCPVFHFGQIIVFERGRLDPFDPGPIALFMAGGDNVCTGQSFVSEGFSREITFAKTGHAIHSLGSLQVFSLNLMTFETTSETVTYSLDVTASSTRLSRRSGQGNLETGASRMSQLFDENTRPATSIGTFADDLFGSPLSAGADPVTLMSDSKSRTVFFQFPK